MNTPVFNLQLDVSMGQSITRLAERRKPFLHHVLCEGRGHPLQEEADSGIPFTPALNPGPSVSKLSLPQSLLLLSCSPPTPLSPSCRLPFPDHPGLAQSLPDHLQLTFFFPAEGSGVKSS